MRSRTHSEKPAQSVQLKSIRCDAETTQGYDIYETFGKLKGAKSERNVQGLLCARADS